MSRIFFGIGPVIGQDCRQGSRDRGAASTAGDIELSCRGFGIAKILKKPQLHTRLGCHQVDAGLDKSGKNVARCRRRPLPGALSAHRIGRCTAVLLDFGSILSAGKHWRK